MTSPNPEPGSEEKRGWLSFDSAPQTGEPFIAGEWHAIYGWLWGRMRWYAHEVKGDGCKGYFAGDVNHPTHWHPLAGPPERG